MGAWPTWCSRHFISSSGRLAVAQPALADDAKPNVNREIIVTGERVKRSLKDTPSTVVVITGPEIDSLAHDRLVPRQARASIGPAALPQPLFQ